MVINKAYKCKCNTKLKLSEIHQKLCQSKPFYYKLVGDTHKYEMSALGLAQGKRNKSQVEKMSARTLESQSPLSFVLALTKLHCWLM